MSRTDHCGEVTSKIARVAHIGRDHFEDVATQLAAIVEPQRRDPDALLPDVGGGGVVGAMRGTTDITLMRPVDRPEARTLFSYEYRRKSG
jgi:hypothetical protein